MIEIPLLHKEILELFTRYKYNWETSSLPMDVLHEWSESVSQLLLIDNKVFSSNMSELFWALSSVQLSIGYALISRQTCQYPKGIKGEAFSEKEVPNFLGISEIHLFYHLNNSWESIYRCWERLSSVLCVVLYPNEGKKLYFIKEDLLKWVQEGKVKTMKEIENDATNYLFKKRNSQR